MVQMLKISYLLLLQNLNSGLKTPLSDADIPEMSASQVMQEQYWQRTRGSVRTALEQCVLALEAYGLSPENGPIKKLVV